MKLQDAEFEKKYRISKYNGETDVRVYELGLYPGQEVIRLNSGIVLSGNSRFAVGRDFLRYMEVNQNT